MCMTYSINTKVFPLLLLVIILPLSQHCHLYQVVFLLNLFLTKRKPTEKQIIVPCILEKHYIFHPNLWVILLLVEVSYVPSFLSGHYISDQKETIDKLSNFSWTKVFFLVNLVVTKRKWLKNHVKTFKPRISVGLNPTVTILKSGFEPRLNK